MPILRLNAGPEGLRLHGSPASARSALATAACGTGPMIIMVHGFKYDPDAVRFSPHTSIFAHAKHPDRDGDVQWLRHLGFGAGNPDEGLAVAFGWRARGNLWRAVRSAHAAGRHIAEVIADLHRRAPQRPIHVITHSMGSEIIFEALQTLPAHSVQRIITLTGASYASRAQQAMTTAAGHTAELINITSRENDLFDFAFERLIPAPHPKDRAMSAGLTLSNAVTVQLDCLRTLSLLAGFGGHIAPPQRRVCHWSGYTRPGVMRFYAHALRRPDAVPLEALRLVLPATTAPRWSRIFARPTLSLPLPSAHKTAS
ncbi:DUF726 domain-containing protein [uncultured Tateyamaria sp.]|uniref:DUF726 domain-containing protein n=1 Tax=uncultured Tateyamaria sp. TaxID=455651 RepID=UPI0026209B81|nr:DUF726 domain-containing protein [uncultured Tateyamaria sp.]